MSPLAIRQVMKSVATGLVVLHTMAASAADLAIGFSSAGTMHVGTQFTQLGIPLRQPIDRTSQDGTGHCFYVEPLSRPRFEIMMIDDRVARFDVYEAGMATTEGVRVGDSVEALRRAYGTGLTASPNAYDEGNLDYRIKSPDGRYAYRFETQAGKVTAMFAGDAKAVEYIEGCL